ncbi:hypothetical protein SAMN02745194_01698 [Roseomonas rosea]|jgi:hypothetical protein|uniref:Uncharacterized protein n=1 Tax=Muricoccus roseus TaxID=198092 RepID=A0A1M6GCR8_9PROT|nr:hypothetical protein [Roseomonas rosea]SHJ07696.1 hypothetical protein SAMN02745194_01698 [Roseomonas rosea]
MRLVRAALMPMLLLATLAACTGNDRSFGERVRDTVDPPSGPVEATGRAVDRAVDRVRPN